MATVFWAGDTFAPKRKVRRSLHAGKFGSSASALDERVGLQTFLQESMIGAFAALAEKIGDCEAVIGFEVSSGIRARMLVLTPRCCAGHE